MTFPRWPIETVAVSATGSNATIRTAGAEGSPSDRPTSGGVLRGITAAELAPDTRGIACGGVDWLRWHAETVAIAATTENKMADRNTSAYFPLPLGILVQTTMVPQGVVFAPRRWNSTGTVEKYGYNSIASTVLGTSSSTSMATEREPSSQISG